MNADAHRNPARQAAANPTDDRAADPRPAESGLSRDLGVLVGFDGSELAALALRYAAIEALHRGVP